MFLSRAGADLRTRIAQSLSALAGAIQIAAATVVNADLMLSWNYRHIVNLDKIRIFNSVNVRLGYKPIEIRSPKDLGNGGEDEEDI